MHNSELLKFPAGKIEDEKINLIKNEIYLFSKMNDINKPLARHKPHLLLPSIYDISLDKEINEKVEIFCGVECMLWYSVLFNKKRNTQNYIPWHYDDYFWNLKGKGCTVWIAVEDVQLDMGPMEFAIDHNLDNFKHVISNDNNNILLRGNYANYQPAKNIEIVKVILKKGEYSIHSNKVMHRSGINLSTKDRMAFALRFISINSYPESFRYLKRGVVSKYKLSKYYFSEKKPKKVSKIFSNKFYIISILSSFLLTFFGDKKRNAIEKFIEFLKFIFSRKILFFLPNKNKEIDIDKG